jgi:hypothetical protein
VLPLEAPYRLLEANTTIVAPVRSEGRMAGERTTAIATNPLDDGAYETVVSGDLPLVEFPPLHAGSVRKALQHHAGYIMPATFGRELSEGNVRAGTSVRFAGRNETTHRFVLSLIHGRTQAALGRRVQTWGPQGNAWLTLSHFADRLAVFANARDLAWPSAWRQH